MFCGTKYEDLLKMLLQAPLCQQPSNCQNKSYNLVVFHQNFFRLFELLSNPSKLEGIKGGWGGFWLVDDKIPLKASIPSSPHRTEQGLHDFVTKSRATFSLITIFASHLVPWTPFIISSPVILPTASLVTLILSCMLVVPLLEVLSAVPFPSRCVTWILLLVSIVGSTIKVVISIAWWVMVVARATPIGFLQSITPTWAAITPYTGRFILHSPTQVGFWISLPVPPTDFRWFFYIDIPVSALVLICPGIGGSSSQARIIIHFKWYPYLIQVSYQFRVNFAAMVDLINVHIRVRQRNIRRLAMIVSPESCLWILKILKGSWIIPVLKDITYWNISLVFTEPLPRNVANVTAEFPFP